MKKNFLKIFILPFLSLLLYSCAAEIKREKSSEAPLEIAIFLPLSGEDGELGAKYSALIKAGLADKAETNFNVTTYDVSDEKRLIASINKVLDRNTKIILGPIFSKETSIVAENTKNSDILIFTLSNNPASAEKDRVFVFGHAPLKQTEASIEFFLGKGFKKFFLLSPKNEYSVSLEASVSSILKAGGLDPAAAEFYSPDLISIKKAVKAVESGVDLINENPDSTEKPVIYISDGPDNLKILLREIKNSNLDKKAVIIGDSKLETEFPGISVYFSGSSLLLDENNIQKIRGLCGGRPSFMDFLSYDLGSVVAEAAGVKFSKETFLFNLKGKVFKGFSGDIKFIDSVAGRKYEIISPKKNGYVNY